jgi:UDP-N-acetylglucosamine:LPS N-acetylglucosamine transferase
VHQTENADLDRSQERYHALGFTESVVLKTFIDDLATAMTGLAKDAAKRTDMSAAMHGLSHCRPT